ncbi:MAG: 4'-phosphopantetheinyl transferase superfamily protein, partial [Campylobacter sp.]|nr:4'-phosphopantetheinyl transferase superfamily protein [Campylobacter sp.]
MLKIGTDITTISRIAKLCEKYGDKFLRRILCKSERKIFVSNESIAGVFASKEA